MSGDRLLNRLKVYRAMRDWTQAELAERARVTRKTINAVERGHFVPSTVLAMRLARLFEVPVEDLFRLPEDGEEWPRPPV